MGLSRLGVAVLFAMLWCTNDASFGPGASCRPLDFTVYFEHSILSIVPDSIFIVISLTRLWNLIHQSRKLSQPSYVQCSLKTVATLLILACTGAMTGLTHLHRAEIGLPKITFTSAVLSVIAATALVPLVCLEHFRTLVPSTLVLCYALVKGLFSAAILRTYTATEIPNNSNGYSVYIVSALAIAAYFVLLVVESIEKRRLFQDAYMNYPKESSTSIITRPLFLWLIPLLWRGRKTRLGLDDLHDVPQEYRAIESRAPLEAALAKTKNLTYASVLSTGSVLFAPVIPRLILVLATFAQPLLVQDMLSYVQKDNPSPEEGWALVGGFVCVYGIMVFATAIYWDKVFGSMVRFRGALVGTIVQKSLRLSSYESRGIGSGTSSTYMSVDVERIGSGLEYFHEIWGAFVSIGLGLVLLYTQAKWAAFMPLLVIFIAMSITSYCGKIMGKRQGLWLAATDRRMKLITSVINNLLPIKMSAYEQPLIDKIGQLQREEMKGASSFFSMIVINVALSNATATFCAVAVLGAYAGIVQKTPSIGKFDTTSIFTILTTVQLLSQPLAMVGQVLPSMFAAYASLKRIESFLNMSEKSPVNTTQSQASKDQESSPSQRTHSNSIIRISSASFSWDESSSAALNNINITLESGRVYMCIGPVASGKTTLMVSMLGETVRLSGSLTVSDSASRIAYAAQDAFIFPGTVRENIVLGAFHDTAKYHLVISSCGLGPDLARLPAGDLTRLGDKGASLSGGQRQRVALARAIYADAPVVFLDDPFSALDAETEAHVAKSLLGTGGLLCNKTVFIITHNVHHLPLADTVIVMAKGSIASQGTLHEFRESGYDLASFVHQDQATSEVSTDEREAQAEDHKADDPGKEKEKEVDDELNRSYNNQGWHPYIFWARMAGFSRVWTSLTFATMWIALSLGTNGYVKEWSESSGNMNLWIIGYTIFSVAYFVTGVIAFWHWCKKTNVEASIVIHEQELKAVMNAPASYLHKTPAGRIVNRFSQDINVLVLSFPMSFFGMFLTGSALSGSLILIVVATPWIAIGLPLLGLVYWLLIKFYLASSTQLQQLESASKSPLYTSFGTIVTGLETIRAFGVQRMFSNHSDAHLNASQGPFHFRFAGMRFLRTVLSFMTMLIAIGMACLAVGLRKSTSAGFLGIALSSLTRVSAFMSNLLTSWAEVENGAVAVERIYEIANLEPEADAGRIVLSPQKAAWPMHGSIVFENYSMKYAENLPHALNNLTFKIQGGLKVGICGRTGSGKSSTINALFRTISSGLTSGYLLIDGIDINELPLHILRSSLSVVPQDPFLWHSTVRENLDLEARCTEDQVWGALERVGMKEAIAELDNKLDTVLEDAVAFSRGQRQLLCMARILLRKRKIVILDEASSSMDLQTDEQVRRIVMEELKECTVLAVAHRIATIVDFDLILTLDDGRLVEVGPPRALLADSTTRFAKLANSQGIYAPSIA